MRCVCWGGSHDEEMTDLEFSLIKYQSWSQLRCHLVLMMSSYTTSRFLPIKPLCCQSWHCSHFLYQITNLNRNSNQNLYLFIEEFTLSFQADLYRFLCFFSPPVANVIYVTTFRKYLCVGVDIYVTLRLEGSAKGQSVEINKHGNCREGCLILIDLKPFFSKQD